MVGWVYYLVDDWEDNWGWEVRVVLVVGRVNVVMGVIFYLYGSILVESF